MMMYVITVERVELVVVVRHVAEGQERDQWPWGEGMAGQSVSGGRGVWCTWAGLHHASSCVRKCRRTRRATYTFPTTAPLLWYLMGGIGSTWLCVSGGST